MATNPTSPADEAAPIFIPSRYQRRVMAIAALAAAPALQEPWDEAFADAARAEAEFKQWETRTYDTAPPDERDDMQEQWDRGFLFYRDLQWALIERPAPTLEALRWKAAFLFDQEESPRHWASPHDWPNAFAQFAADLQRLLPQTGGEAPA